MSQMLIRVRLFACLRECAGTDSLEIELASGATVADAMRTLAGHDALGETLGRMPVHMAVNRDYAAADTVLAPEDELALIPPISGGAAGEGEGEGELPVSRRTGDVPIHVRVSERPLSLQALSQAVGDPGAGAIVVFQGVTRDVERLDYEAYTEMAEERIEAIVRECVAAHGLRGGRRRAPRRPRRARRAERDRRVVGGASRGSVRRCARDDRSDQGAGADLEARARRWRSRALGAWHGADERELASA